MATFVFEVEERTFAPGDHSWVAIETASGVALALPHGGNSLAGKSFIGRYPEIQDFLRQEHRLDVRLVYDTELDDRIPHADGKTTWVFHRQDVEVIVRDIPRVAGGVALGG